MFLLAIEIRLYQIHATVGHSQRDVLAAGVFIVVPFFFKNHNLFLTSAVLSNIRMAACTCNALSLRSQEFKPNVDQNFRILY